MWLLDYLLRFLFSKPNDDHRDVHFVLNYGHKLNKIYLFSMQIEIVEKLCS